MKMFTKEKLEKWIKSLKGEINQLNSKAVLVRRIEPLEELLHTLEQIYTSMTSDNSI